MVGKRPQRRPGPKPRSPCVTTSARRRRVFAIRWRWTGRSEAERASAAAAAASSASRVGRGIDATGVSSWLEVSMAARVDEAVNKQCKHHQPNKHEYHPGGIHILWKARSQSRVIYTIVCQGDVPRKNRGIPKLKVGQGSSRREFGSWMSWYSSAHDPTASVSVLVCSHETADPSSHTDRRVHSIPRRILRLCRNVKRTASQPRTTGTSVRSCMSQIIRDTDFPIDTDA